MDDQLVQARPDLVAAPRVDPAAPPVYTTDLAVPEASSIDPDRSAAFWRERARDVDGHGAVALADGVPPEVVAWTTGRAIESARALLEVEAPYARMLDVGCGDGLWTVALADLAEEVVAMDFREEFVHRTRDLAQARGVAHLRASTGSWRSVDPEERFDLVVLGAVLMYFDDAELPLLLRRVEEVLAPGGLIYVRVSTCRRASLYNTGGAYQAVYRSPEAYRRLFTRNGMEVHRVQVVPEYTYDDIVEG